MSPLARGLTSVLLLLHLIAVVGSLAIGTPPGDLIRSASRGYERFAGVYQGWSMFAPNPPVTDRWMVITGRTPSGEWISLPPLMGERETAAIELRYQRAGKLERNLLSSSRKRALRDYAQWLCRQHGVTRVRIEQVSQRTPKPSARREGAEPERMQTRARTEYCQ